MDLRPVTHYTPPGYPQGTALGEDELAQALLRRWRRRSKVIAALTACLALSGCGGPAPQSVDEAVDRAMIALHLRQPQTRLPGAMMAPMPPAPNPSVTAKPTKPTGQLKPVPHPKGRKGTRK